MDQAPLEQSGKAPNQAYRLTLAHLLVWMVMTALLMAVYRDGFRLAQDQRDDHPVGVSAGKLLWIDAVAEVMAAPFESLALSGLGLLALRRGKSCSVQPGHFLLIAVGSFILTRLIAEFAWHRMILPWFDDPDTFDRWIDVVMAIIEVCDGVPFAVAGALIAVFVVRYRLPVVWSIPLSLGFITMLGISAVQVLNIVGYKFFPITMWTEFLAWWTWFMAVVALIAAALADVLTRESRDLLHYAGVLVVLAEGAHALVSPIALRVVVAG